MRKPKPHQPQPFAPTDPRSRWVGPEHLAKITVNGVPATALIDGGAQVNAVTSRFQEEHGLPLYPLSELLAGDITIVGNAGVRTSPKGFTLAKIRIEGIAGYEEENVLLVQDDDSLKGEQVPIVLGTCTINRVIPRIKES